MENIKQLYKIDEVCEQLNISRSMIYRLMENGSLNPIRLGKSVRFSNLEIARFVQGLTRTEATPK